MNKIIDFINTAFNILNALFVIVAVVAGGFSAIHIAFTGYKAENSLTMSIGLAFLGIILLLMRTSVNVAKLKNELEAVKQKLRKLKKPESWHD
jgi:uncharacterized membrane protein